MKKLVFFGLGLVIWSSLLAQGRIDFKKTSHDFGQIKEVDGAAEFTFTFVNSGNQSVMISNVKASCGCTTPFWTKEEILPGDSGRVTAQFNTSNRPGAFNKSLTVITNSSTPTISLSIRGFVEPKPKTVEDDLPTKLGAIRMKYRSFNMGKVTTEKPVTMAFDVYNDSESTLSFLTAEMIIPEHLLLEFLPNKLQPKEKGLIKITYDPIMKNDLGYQTDLISIVTSEEIDGKKELPVVATIEEYFPPMTEADLANSPKLFIHKKEHDFGRVVDGSIAETEFFITNSGKSVLSIRDTQSNCECTVSKLTRDTIQPGETVALKLTFDTKGRRGKQYKNVTIFSNDPVAPTQMVTIKAEVGG